VADRLPVFDRTDLGGFVKLDTHVHTFHSGRTSIYPLSLIMSESYNTPERVVRTAGARGMDLVAITDHDEISGALAVAHLPHVIVGCEVTGRFPDDGVRVHLNVLGISERQHREIQRRQGDVRDLLPYLKEERIFTSLNHVASGVNGPITAPHVAGLLPWIDALEVINGSRLVEQNRTARCLADAAGVLGIAGSDSHTERGIGLTWTEVPGASSRAEFLSGLMAGRARVGGRHGHLGTMASDMLRLAGGFYHDRFKQLTERPFDWRAHAFVFGGVLGLPLVALPLAGAYVHFLTEERFNRDLLYDLVARPAQTRARVPELAA
jgi:predicted metal-dependent phosphoesterase TrpH